MEASITRTQTLTTTTRTTSVTAEFVAATLPSPHTRSGGRFLDDNHHGDGADETVDETEANPHLPPGDAVDEGPVWEGIYFLIPSSTHPRNYQISDLKVCRQKN